MKISVKWLRELASLPLEKVSDDALANALTFLGFEVEQVTRVGAATGVIVAELLSAKPHPEAKALSLVTINAGGKEPVEVVCGAPTLPPAGSRIAWAAPGATLPGMPGPIEPKKIRGVVSPGMLCAEDEIGLSDSHDGLVVLDRERPLGSDAMVGLADSILELNVTPNRPDGLSHIGIAREVAAHFATRLKVEAISSVTAGAIERPELVAVAPPTSPSEGPDCLRYIGTLIEGVAVGPSPVEVQRRLRNLGVRPISNVVDATNLTMLELGHPLHAFDASKLSGGSVVVRRAKLSERLTTLDGKERALGPDDLVIADRRATATTGSGAQDATQGGAPAALAGVMGGASTEVSAATTTLFLEAASFAPAIVRRMAKRHGLSSEASYRFERGVDPHGVAKASQLCAARIVAWAGGKVTASTDWFPQPTLPGRVSLRIGRVDSVLGRTFSPGQVKALLEGIGLAVVEGKAEGTLDVTIPTFRSDLGREADLIEEIARLEGYEKIPARLPTQPATPATINEGAQPSDSGRNIFEDRVRDLLVADGFCEAVTFGFTAPQKIEALAFPAADPRSTPLRVINPLRDETTALRTSLLPNLLSALRLNLDRGNGDVALFEVGVRFLVDPHKGPPVSVPGPIYATVHHEELAAAFVLAGAASGHLCPPPGRPMDFYDAKGAIERVLAGLGLSALFARKGLPPFLHPGVGATLWLEDQPIGSVGEVHLDVRKRFGIEGVCFCAELDLEKVLAAAKANRQHGQASFGPVQATALPRFPAVSRDLSMFVDAEVAAGDLASVLRAAKEPLLERVSVVEEFMDKARVPAGKKGLLFSLIYRASDRTLTDADVQSAHGKLVASLEQAHTITIR